MQKLQYPLQGKQGKLPDYDYLRQQARSANSDQTDQRKLPQQNYDYEIMEQASQDEGTGRGINSPNKSSQQVLKRVFDEEFSVSSPQKNKQQQLQQSMQQPQVIDQMNTIAQNLSRLNLNETSNQQQSDQKEGLSKSLEKEDLQQDVIDENLFDNCYKSFLGKIANEKQFVNASYENKIALIIEYFNNQNLDSRLGSLIFLFELIYNFRNSLNEQTISLILSQLYLNIPQYYANKDFYMVYCALEIIALVGPHNISYNNIKLLASILIDEEIPILQDKAFLALINFDYPGFFALLDIANKDFNEIPIFIMNKLAKTEDIILQVIIPSLLNDINGNDQRKKITSLAALNRMFSMIWKGGALPILINLLNEGSIDRQLVVSTIRACGEVGEQTLLKNSKIKLAISTVLSWRVSKNESNKLDIKIVPYQVAEHYNVNPGTMCIYKGDITPLAFVEESYNFKQDCIEVNSRDFMAALQRLLAVRYEKFQQSQDGMTTKHDIIQNGFLHDFTLVKLIDQNLIQQNEDKTISAQIIKGVQLLMNDENAQVREAAVNTLGLIGSPEGNAAIEQLFKSLFDQSSQARAMAAWCCGRLSEACTPKINRKLLDLLKDSYWKVRTAACVAIGAIGQNIDDLAFQALMKVLKEGTINKLTVCETFVRLGVYGEQILIDLLKNTPQSNFKLKTAIILSFQLANVTKPTIDFIIEELFKNANDQMLQVRKACLQTLECLRNRAQDTNITYLKSRNILPLFYYFLQDQSNEIKDMALNSIRQFGPQAELIFIEGLTKDKNPSIRCQCAKGLGSMGVQNFRALLFGLRDVEENVRNSTAKAIRSNFTVENIIEEFKNKQNQVPSLICNIKDIFNLPFALNDKVKVILEEVLASFGETFSKDSKSQNENQLSQPNQLLSQQPISTINTQGSYQNSQLAQNYIQFLPKQHDTALFSDSNKKQQPDNELLKKQDDIQDLQQQQDLINQEINQYEDLVQQNKQENDQQENDQQEDQQQGEEAI